MTRLALALALLVGTASAQDNVLLLLADDLGVDRVAAYGEHPDPGHTPVIDALAAGGVLFRNAWSSPSCSPTRAGLMTGQHAFRTGVGFPIDAQYDRHALWSGETTLPRLLEPDVACLLVGKWHLGLDQAGLPGLGPALQHPLACGFRRFWGSFSGISQPALVNDDYTDWIRVVDGVPQHCTTYNTTATVDDALTLIAATPEPWFAYVAFNAPHHPYHAPPPELHGFTLPPTVEEDLPLHAKAAVEAMDTEIGRLLASLDPDVRSRTLVIFAGDNGTAKEATTAPFLPSHAKGTVFEGGVNVPLIVNGPGVARGAECAGLVTTTDLFATIADVFGVEHPTGLDSLSLLPYFSDPAQPSLRATVFTETFQPNGFAPWTSRSRAVRDARFKLIRRQASGGQVDRLFDLSADPFEQVDLLKAPLSPEAAAAYAALVPALDPAPEPVNRAGLGVLGCQGEPRLSGASDMRLGSPVELLVENARALSPAALFIGLSWGGLPCQGGLMGPLPLACLVGLTTDASGSFSLQATCPAGLMASQQIVLQAWIIDQAAPKGVAATNNLLLTPAGS